MTNSAFKSIADYRDVAARNGYALVQQQGGNQAAFLHGLARFGRDNSRTPFQWDATTQAGFTTGTPWLSVNPNYTTINKAAQDKDSSSVLNHFRQATALRRQHNVLVYGQYALLDADNPHIWAYTRTLGGERALVVLNFSSEPRRWTIPTDLKPTGQPWLNNYPTLTAGPGLALQPWQAVVLPL
jgi:oligo-1,6-glucosidase